MTVTISPGDAAAGATDMVAVGAIVVGGEVVAGVFALAPPANCRAGIERPSTATTSRATLASQALATESLETGRDGRMADTITSPLLSQGLTGRPQTLKGTQPL